MDKSALIDAPPIFALSRDHCPEIVVSGHVMWKTEGEKAQGANVNAGIISRSLLKPWQFLAAEVADQHQYWAMGLSSHSGQEIHLKQLAELATAAEAGEDDLFCPRALPLDPLKAAQIKLQGARPDRINHPCSGKHLMILAACRKHDYPLDGYWGEDHPFQKKLYGLIGNLAGERHSWLTDSCGVPTLAARGALQMQLWEKLAMTKGAEFDLLRDLWTSHPRLIGGYGRIDSDLVEIGEGRILAKEGADGLLMVQVIPGAGDQAVTCLVKLAGGYSPAYLALGLLALLESKKVPMPKALQLVAEYLRSRQEEWVPRDQTFNSLLGN